MTAKTYSCPKCGLDVTTKDINVEKDIMLCPSCGEVSSFSEVIGVAREAEREDESRRGMWSGARAGEGRGMEMARRMGSASESGETGILAMGCGGGGGEGRMCLSGCVMTAAAKMWYNII